MENAGVSLAQWSQSRKLELVGEGRQIIDLSMINPDIPPTKKSMDLLVDAASRPQNHRYSVARGLKKLREAFSLKYSSKWGVALSPEEEICITSGSKEAVLLLLRWCIPEHSTVLIPAPYYPAHLSAAKLGGHNVEMFRLGNSEAETLLAIEEGLSRHRPAVLILNFPNNPTGALVSREFYSKLAVLAERFGTLVYNDFVYGELSFSGRATSMLEEPYFRDNGLESYSISKAYSVPGWRVAAMCGAKRWVKRLAELKSKTDYGLFIPLQVAAAETLALGTRVAEEYALRARGFVKDLLALGFKVHAPLAGCAIWCKPERYSVDYLVRELLENHGVLVSCGSSFGEDFSDMVRIALVAPPATLSNVIEAIKEI
jgi:alanine-synthesizing transaminase